jgi:hypothetical protein
VKSKKDRRGKVKKCLKCDKTYDDSWGVCLKCGSGLTDMPGSGSEEREKKEAPASLGGKRSKGVTILAWVSIIFCSLALLGSFDIQGMFKAYQSFSRGWIIALVIYGFLSSIIGIVAGIGILKLRDVMRKIKVGINVLDFIIGVPVYFLSFESAKKYYYETAIAELGKHPELNPDVFQNLIGTSYMLIVVIALALTILNIYFFTHPKVKAQFR